MWVWGTGTLFPVHQNSQESQKLMETSPASPSPSRAPGTHGGTSICCHLEANPPQNEGPRQAEGTSGSGWQKSPILQLERGQHGATQPIANVYPLLCFYLIRQYIYILHTPGLVWGLPYCCSATWSSRRGTIINMLTICVSTSGRTLPTWLGCFTYFSPRMYQKRNLQ